MHVHVTFEWATCPLSGARELTFVRTDGKDKNNISATFLGKCGYKQRREKSL
jgi:hypothetical protein